MFQGRNQRKRSISAADFAYQTIKEKIIRGELEAEESVVEEKLAKLLDISRTPLREALQRLEIEELVVRKLNGRLIVAPMSIQEVEEIFTIRSLLEGIVVSEAAKKASKDQIDQLIRLMKRFELTVKSGEVEELLYLGGEFHSHIYEMSGNKTAVKILYQLNDHIHRYRRFVPLEYRNQQQSLKEHEEILKYIKDGNGELAKTAMENHIINSLHSVVYSLKQRKRDDEDEK